MSAPFNWQDIVAAKREHRASLIPQHWQIKVHDQVAEYNPLKTLLESGVLTPEELDLTNTSKHDAVGTLSLIAAGSVSAENLVTSFCKRAAAADSLTNFITEVNFERAILRAKELDKHLKETGNVVGPLHGLPITVKDHMDVEGHDSSAGIAAFCFDPAKSNSYLVQILIDSGAVVVAKTNVPQTCLAADTINVVFGRTLNAHKSGFGAGGSSGGEGTALAMGASLFGLGSDGAGSARMPAMANGVVGYRPSGYRLPADGRSILDPGIIGITQLGPVATFGFMGHSVRDIRLITKLVSDFKPWEKDPFLYPSPWLSITAPARPRIGVWALDITNNFCHLFPPVRRGFLAAQERLRLAGYELVEFTPPDMSEVWNLCKAFIHVQGISTLTKEISKEPTMDIVEKTGILGSRWSKGLKIEDVHELNQKLALLNIQMKQAWNASGSPLDALLWVTSPNPALPIDEWTDTTFTTVFNAVDWPAISLPLGMKCDKEVDVPYKDFQPFSTEDARLQALYEPHRFHGLPLSVQLAGQKFEDEKLLTIAECIHPIMGNIQ
ncbi:amidase signature domain-containing protein [Ilyonectria robusta]|uniref:amidase signature domain-containing protein n=1 Tax=Ilyonectria robusta TaxID=1079257 RepID=UPI001E8E6B73|nr:amidase signature domain-containing protein [Ilyonectria robusta]KAH8669370.1 amidase signature domain-containing protein [Ilyonectria robusta]